MRLRRVPLAALLALAACLSACEAPEDPTRLVTVESEDRLGMSLRELPRATLSSIGLGYGLAIIKLGTAAERAGLRLGDVVYGVNQTKIRNLREFSQAIGQPVEGRVGLLVRRGKTDLYVPMEIGTSGMPDILKGPRPSTDTLLRT
jgi:hypothetical protein